MRVFFRNTASDSVFFRVMDVVSPLPGKLPSPSLSYKKNQRIIRGEKCQKITLTEKLMPPTA